MNQISISNLAFRGVALQSALPVVERAGFDAIEVAPSALWPTGPDVAKLDVSEFSELLAAHNLGVSGLQSLLFGRSELQLLNRSDWPELRQHLQRQIALASKLQAKVLVFGSPRNRLKGSLGEKTAFEMAAEFFLSLEEDLFAAGAVLTLEPNAPEYGADFITSYQEAVRLAQLIGSKTVQPQIDTGCMKLVGESVAESLRLQRPAHFHISVPGLGNPAGSDVDASVIEILRQSKYSGALVVEMLGDQDTFPTVIEEAGRWVRSAYTTAEALFNG